VKQLNPYALKEGDPLPGYPLLDLSQALQRLHPGGHEGPLTRALARLALLPSIEAKTTHLNKEARWMAEVPSVPGAISHGDTEVEAATRARVLAGLLLGQTMPHRAASFSRNTSSRLRAINRAPEPIWIWTCVQTFGTLYA
jgi:predicted RNase H-like HicB family nuclease